MNLFSSLFSWLHPETPEQRLERMVAANLSRLEAERFFERSAAAKRGWKRKRQASEIGN